MNVSIVGSGFVGTQLAKALLQAGHSVLIASRTPHSEKMQAIRAELGVEVGTVAEALAFAEVVAIAMSWQDIPAMIAGAEGWQDKIIIDMNNRFGGAQPPSQELAQLTGGRVVKALNSIGAEHYTAPQIGGQQASMLLAGDDGQAKQIVAGLLNDIGFEPLDIGSLQDGHHLDNLAALWVHLAMRTSLGRRLAFRVLRD